MTGYDIDGVLTAGYEPQADDVVISGRTFAEYDGVAKEAAKICPVYIRGVGGYGHREHAGNFKATMINLLGVDKFYEDDPVQKEIIETNCPDCTVILVTGDK